jgi:hypothetical protein
MVGEGLDGAPTIRLYGQQLTFLSRFSSIVDLNSAASLNFVSAQRYVPLLPVRLCSVSASF